MNSFSQEILSVEKIETITTQAKYRFGMGTANSKENAEKTAIEDLKVQLMDTLKSLVEVEKIIAEVKTGIVSSKGYYQIIAYIEDENIATNVTMQKTTTYPVKLEKPTDIIIAETPEITIPEFKTETKKEDFDTIKSDSKTELNTESIIKPTSVIEDLLFSESEEILHQKLINYSDSSELLYTDRLGFVKDVLKELYIIVIQNNKIIAFLSPYNNYRYDYVSKTQISNSKQKYYDNPENKFFYINILKNK